MLPFAVKVVWFCLSFTGMISCWLVLHFFSRAIGCRWIPLLYGVFATLLEGIFCLGMIYDMNPLQMPKAFCIVQTFVIYYSAWSLTGVCATFTFATASSVLWPSPTEFSAAATLAWKNKYYIPIVVFPLTCLSVSLPVLLSVNAIEPTDDLHCDASHPEWGRFLGYAGPPLILTIPCFFLSVAAAHRILQLHRSNPRSYFSFKTSTIRFHSRSQPSNEQNVTSERLPSPFISSDNTTPASLDPESLCSPRPTGARADVRGAALSDYPDISPSTSSGALSASHRPSGTRENIGEIDGEDEFDPQRLGGTMCSSITPVVSPSKPNLASAIWRLILFQMAFFIIQCLAALSTVIDVVQHKPTPTPFGSQHVALILVGWGPAIVFGHLPSVWRQLVFWKK